jgi:sulfonate transport system ATP-binding protein
VDSVVRVRSLVRQYGSNRVLDGLDLDVAAGEFVVLLGASGCGKTTLLRTLAGLDVADGGTVEVPANAAYVFQEPRLLPWRSANSNIRLALHREPRRSAQQRAAAALVEVGLPGRDAAKPATLSGGQAQRVALARALVSDPQLLLLDEPFAALDALTRIAMQDLVLALVARHRPATVLVTHDVNEAYLVADRIAVMADGRITSIHEVRKPRPRDPETADAARLRRVLLNELGVHA